MKHRYLMFAAIFLAIPLIALAGSNTEHYNALVAAPTERIVNATAADSLVIGTKPITAARVVEVNGNPTAYARVDFSGAAADTCLIYANLWLKRGTTWTYLGSWQTTVTAGAVVDATGDNVGTNLAVFDTGCASHIEIRNGLPSAGSVDVTYWAGAADSK